MTKINTFDDESVRKIQRVVRHTLSTLEPRPKRGRRPRRGGGGTGTAPAPQQDFAPGQTWVVIPSASVAAGTALQAGGPTSGAAKLIGGPGLYIDINKDLVSGWRGPWGILPEFVDVGVSIWNPYDFTVGGGRPYPAQPFSWEFFGALTLHVMITGLNIAAFSGLGGERSLFSPDGTRFEWGGAVCPDA